MQDCFTLYFGDCGIDGPLSSLNRLVYYLCAGAQEVHGHARIPYNYNDRAHPGWVQAARWLQKNAKLFLKDKLPAKRYALIQEVLGARP